MVTCEIQPRPGPFAPAPPPGFRGRGRALVIGAGVAGLAAAQALSAHFESVTLVERDPLPAGAAGRRGIPQAPHQHLLLARGRILLEALIPGIGAEIAAAGTEPMDVAQELAWLAPAGWSPRFRSGITILPCSRGLLERLMRERVLANPAVELLDGLDVVGLVAGPGGAVAGVRARPSDRRGAEPDELPADLVVDASGRGSRLPGWLQELGVPAPQRSVVDAGVVYASCVFDGLPSLPDGWRGAFLQAAPPASTRGGTMLPVEGGRTLVTLIGRGEDDPPTELAGFLAYAASLRSDLIHDAVAGLAPLTPVALTRATRNRRHHYERVRPWPAGLVALGDSACAFNPVYGQGMTTALLAATELDRLLAACPPGSPPVTGSRFQRRLARLTAAPWTVDTALDRRAAGAAGASTPRRTLALQGYLARVGRLGSERPDARLASLEVAHMLAGPQRLLRPGILLRVLARSARARLPRATATAPGARR
jgi:2-polyprenyl-6-methoxyphenol hydroxylase-like FAD-dependent oxidoreductase